MVAVPSPDQDPTSWDTMTLGGQLLPGIVLISFPSKHDIEKKKAKGKAKATLKDNGDPPREPQITWMFDAEKDWARFLEIWPMIQDRKAGATKKQLDAVHPRLALHGVSVLVIEEVDGPNIEKMLATVTLKTVETAKPVAQKAIGFPASVLARAADIERQMALAREHARSAFVAGDEVARARYLKEEEDLRALLNKPSSKAAQDHAPTGNIF